MGDKYGADYEIRVFGQNARDRQDLTAALTVFARNTSHLLRTQANQIQWKINNPNNPNGDFYFVGLYKDRRIVGFAMFGYYPRRHLVVLDHMAIDVQDRKHGSFYVFAALLQECIEKRCPDFDYVAAEIGVDREFAEDEVAGPALIRLLRQLGFGRVQLKYFLANTQPKEYKRLYRGALMLRGPQKITQIRAEDLYDIYEAILFEHYLPWYKDFFWRVHTEIRSAPQNSAEGVQRPDFRAVDLCREWIGRGRARGQTHTTDQVGTRLAAANGRPRSLVHCDDVCDRGGCMVARD